MKIFSLENKGIFITWSLFFSSALTYLSYLLSLERVTQFYDGGTIIFFGGMPFKTEIIEPHKLFQTNSDVVRIWVGNILNIWPNFLFWFLVVIIALAIFRKYKNKNAKVVNQRNQI